LKFHPLPLSAPSHAVVSSADLGVLSAERGTLDFAQWVPRKRGEENLVILLREQ
jgi:hypothetical protein